MFSSAMWLASATRTPRHRLPTPIGLGASHPSLRSQSGRKKGDGRLGPRPSSTAEENNVCPAVHTIAWQAETCCDPTDCERERPARSRVHTLGTERTNCWRAQLALTFKWRCHAFGSRSIIWSRVGQSFRPISDFSIRTAFRSELWTSIFPL